MQNTLYTQCCFDFISSTIVFFFKETCIKEAVAVQADHDISAMSCQCLAGFFIKMIACREDISSHAVFSAVANFMECCFSQTRMKRVSPAINSNKTCSILVCKRINN